MPRIANAYHTKHINICPNLVLFFMSSGIFHQKSLENDLALPTLFIFLTIHQTVWKVLIFSIRGIHKMVSTSVDNTSVIILGNKRKPLLCRHNKLSVSSDKKRAGAHNQSI